MKRPTLTRPPTGPAMALVPRIFAVLAAVFLVGSVALAALLPSDMTLFETLNAIRLVRPDHLQQVVTSNFGHFAWMSVVVPLLVRRVWLVPVSLGLICVGVAVTSLKPTAPGSKQRS